jgi:hypothetical protein
MGLITMLFILKASAVLISTFPAGDASWHLGTLGLGQLDSSPDLEIVVPYRNSSGHWFLDAFKYNGTRLAGFPYSAGGEEINASPTLYDLDGDGRDEIIFTRANHVLALRGNGSLVWSNTVTASNYVPNSGYQTVTNGFYWSNGGGFIDRFPSAAVFSSQVSPPIVADVNGDGTNEIVTAWKIDPDPASGFQDFNPFINDIFGSGEWGTAGETWSGGVVFFDASTGKQNFVYHLHQLLEAGLAIGRAEPKAALDVYALNDSDSVVCFDRTKPFGLWGSGMLHKQFGKNQRLMTGSYLQPIDIYAADLDGDGRDEVLVAGSQLGTLWQPKETILDHDGSILWRRWLPHLDITHNFGWHNSAALIPVNPDHDNHIDVLGFNHSYEITFRYWDGVELATRSGWPKNFYPLLPTPPIVGDVDGDGQEEIVIGTYNPSLTPSSGSLLIYGLDGTLELTLPVAGGIKHIPALADANGDGKLDVIYRSTLGQVSIHNLGATTTSAVSWSTHRGNMRRDGNRGSLFPPGTPSVTNQISGFQTARFSWANVSGNRGYRIYRAARSDEPLQHIATVASNVTSFAEVNLQNGWQFFYVVGAIQSTGTVFSAPFAITPLCNSNLIANAGFEANDNSRWDKWFSDLDPADMQGCTNMHQGCQAMRVSLQNQGSSSTISQCNQYGIPKSGLAVGPGAFYSFGGWFKSDAMSQTGEHWLEWTSAKTAADTNNRPLRPFPSYFTPPVKFGATPGTWTYANRVFQMPPGFPNAELGHRFSAVGGVKGSLYLDNLFFRQIPAPTATNWSPLISFGDTWRYFSNPPGTNWFSPTFDDSAWPLGYAKFGAGSGPTNITTRLPQQKSNYYFRKRFVVNSACQELLLAATCTDNYGGTIYPLRVFLNGIEIKSSGIETVSGQGNETRYFDLTAFEHLLRLGDNLIAVQLGNSFNTSWDDVAFDLSLRAIPRASQLSSLKVVSCEADSVHLVAETPSGTVWQLESCDGFSAPWLPVEKVDGGIQELVDTGQNGRLSPRSVKTRMYRLRPY